MDVVSLLNLNRQEVESLFKKPEPPSDDAPGIEPLHRDRQAPEPKQQNN